jgi:5-methylcytosine-specific restriction protein A
MSLAECLNNYVITKIKDAVTGKAPLTAKRSPKWITVRAKFLKENSSCAACGGKNNLNVHHIKPFHLYPELELEPSNLITLCECNQKGINCHLLVGHLGNFKSINPYIFQDLKVWFKRFTGKRSLFKD